jgi:hypothetical protein
MIRANHTLHPEANSLPCSVHDPASDSIQSAMEAVLVAIASGYYTVTHFAISTNTNEFISEKLQWRQNLIALDKVFPSATIKLSLSSMAPPQSLPSRRRNR